MSHGVRDQRTVDLDERHLIIESGKPRADYVAYAHNPVRNEGSASQILVAIA